MNLQKDLEIEIPSETVSSALQLFPKNNRYLKVGDSLNDILAVIDLQKIDSSVDENIQTVLRLSLLTAFQFEEKLSDHQTSSAVLRRVDWKYALFLPLNYPGIAWQNLSHFRQKLISSNVAMDEFGNFLSILEQLNFFVDLQDLMNDPKELIFFICQLNSVQLLRETMKSALGLLVSLEPDWLVNQVSPHWFERYRSGFPGFSHSPNNIEIASNAVKIGSDIYALLVSVLKLNSKKINLSSEILRLNQIFQQQFYFSGEIICWRLPDCRSCICSNSLQEGG